MRLLEKYENAYGQKLRKEIGDNSTIGFPSHAPV